MVVKTHFLHHFLCRSAFSPYLCHAKRTMVVHPGEQRLLLGHQGRAFFMPAKARVTTRKKDIGGCHSVEFDQPIG